MGALDAGLVRAMAASTRGNAYSVQQQHLLGWTHCGLVVSHKGKPYVLLPATEGIEVLPAAKQIARWALEGVKVAVRQLVASDLDAERLALVCRDLLHAALQGCAWSAFLPELKQDEAGRAVLPREAQRMRLPRAAPGSSLVSRAPAAAASAASNAASAASSKTAASAAAATDRDGAAERADAALAPLSRQLLRLLVPRVWAALRAVPPRVEVELRRAFARTDTDGDGLVSAGDVRRILTDVRGGDVSRGDAEAFLRRMGPPAAVRVASDEAPSSGANAHAASVSTGAGAAPSLESAVRTSTAGAASVISGASVASVALYSLDHFLLGFARRPLTELPIEADPAALLCGEFVATVYELLGLLPLRTASSLTPADAYAAAASSRTSTRSNTGTGHGHSHGDGCSPSGASHSFPGGSAGSSPLRTVTAGCALSPAGSRTVTSGSHGSPHHFRGAGAIASVGAAVAYAAPTNGHTGESKHGEEDEDSSLPSSAAATLDEKHSPSRSGAAGVPGIASPAGRSRAAVSLAGPPSHAPALSTGLSESGASAAAGSSVLGRRRSSTGIGIGTPTHDHAGNSLSHGPSSDGRRRLSGLADALASAASATAEAEAEAEADGAGSGGWDDAVGVSMDGSARGSGHSGRRTDSAYTAAVAHSRGFEGKHDDGDEPPRLAGHVASSYHADGATTSCSGSASDASTPKRGGAFPIGTAAAGAPCLSAITGTPPAAALRSAAVHIVPLRSSGSAGASGADPSTEHGSGRRGSARSSVSSIGAATARILSLIDGTHAGSDTGNGVSAGIAAGAVSSRRSSAGASPALSSRSPLQHQHQQTSADDSSHVSLAVTARDNVAVTVTDVRGSGGSLGASAASTAGLIGRSASVASASGAGGPAGAGGSDAGTGSPWWTRTSSGAGASPTVTHSGGALTSASAGGNSASGGQGGTGGASTLVVIDSACGDLRHFTPATFSAAHVPRLTLLRGYLEPESLIDVSAGTDAAASDRDAAAASVRLSDSSAGALAGTSTASSRPGGSRGAASNSAGASAPSHLAPAAAATIHQLTAGVFTTRSTTSGSAASGGSATSTARPAVATSTVMLSSGGSSNVVRGDASASSAAAGTAPIAPHSHGLSTFSLAVHGAASSSSPDIRSRGSHSGHAPEAVTSIAGVGGGAGTRAASPALYSSLSRATVAWSEESTSALTQGASPANAAAPAAAATAAAAGPAATGTARRVESKTSE